MSPKPYRRVAAYRGLEHGGIAPCDAALGFAYLNLTACDTVMTPGEFFHIPINGDEAETADEGLCTADECSGPAEEHGDNSGIVVARLLVAHKASDRHDTAAVELYQVAQDGFFGKREGAEARTDTEHEGIESAVAQGPVDLTILYSGVVGRVEGDRWGPLPVAAMGEVDGDAFALGENAVDQRDIHELHAAAYLAVAYMEEFDSFDEGIAETAVETTSHNGPPGL